MSKKLPLFGLTWINLEVPSPELGLGAKLMSATACFGGKLVIGTVVNRMLFDAEYHAFCPSNRMK